MRDIHAGTGNKATYREFSDYRVIGVSRKKKKTTKGDRKSLAYQLFTHLQWSRIWTTRNSFVNFKKKEKKHLSVRNSKQIRDYEIYLCITVLEELQPLITMLFLYKIHSVTLSNGYLFSSPGSSTW